MEISRRSMLKTTALGAFALSQGGRFAAAQTAGGAAIEPEDRVFIANEDSNTVSVIDPRSNTVETTINLTSFDEDPRPPFRFVTGGAVPTHAAMINKPLYHGAIAIHGVVPSPDGRLLATSGRGTSNVYLIDTVARRVVGNRPNPQASATTNAERLTSGILVGREPHEPTFTPFQKTSPDGNEVWLSHKLADRVSAVETHEAFRVLDSVPLGNLARPNHLEFVQNARGKAIYVSLARVDDGGPGDVASSQIAIIDHSAPPGLRKVVGSFFTRGREAHGLWTNPSNTLLYVAHEQDELPGAPAAGQTVASAFDVSNPFAPAFVAQIPLGSLKLPSGELRNKKSINLVYVRPGTKGQTA